MLDIELKISLSLTEAELLFQKGEGSTKNAKTIRSKLDTVKQLIRDGSYGAAKVTLQEVIKTWLTGG